MLSSAITEGEKRDLERKIVELETQKSAADQRVKELETHNSVLEKQCKIDNQK